MKGLARGLVLKQRHETARQWPILLGLKKKTIENFNVVFVL